MQVESYPGLDKLQIKESKNLVEALEKALLVPQKIDDDVKLLIIDKARQLEAEKDEANTQMLQKDKEMQVL